METNRRRHFVLEPNAPLKGDKNGNLRLLIVGNSGVGKSTIASRLSSILQLPVIYLDELYWQPNWKETHDGEFREKVESFVRENDSWIIDGNYIRFMSDLTFRTATCIVWLDPPFALYFPRLVLRTFLRLFRITPPCSQGCDESLSDIFTWGEKSILWWCWTNHTPQREFGSTQMQEPGEDKGGKWIRFGGWGGEINAWLKRIEALAKTQ